MRAARRADVLWRDHYLLATAAAHKDVSRGRTGVGASLGHANVGLECTVAAADRGDTDASSLVIMGFSHLM